MSRSLRRRSAIHKSGKHTTGRVSSWTICGLSGEKMQRKRDEDEREERNEFRCQMNDLKGEGRRRKVASAKVGNLTANTRFVAIFLSLSFSNLTSQFALTEFDGHKNQWMNYRTKGENEWVSREERNRKGDLPVILVMTLFLSFPLLAIHLVHFMCAPHHQNPPTIIQHRPALRQGERDECYTRCWWWLLFILRRSKGREGRNRLKRKGDITRMSSTVVL